MPRLSLDSLFLGWSHLGSNLRKTNCACLMPKDGEISTLKLATRSAFCLVPGTSGPQNSCTQTWAFKETHCTLISYELLVASNCQHLINRFKHDVSRIHNFCANICQPQKRGVAPHRGLHVPLRKVCPNPPQVEAPRCVVDHVVILIDSLPADISKSTPKTRQTQHLFKLNLQLATLVAEQQVNLLHAFSRSFCDWSKPITWEKRLLSPRSHKPGLLVASSGNM